MSDKNTRKTNDPEQEAAQPDGTRDTEHLATGGPPADETGPELDSAGSDQETNVTGRSKPASDSVAQHQRDKHQGKS